MFTRHLMDRGVGALDGQLHQVFDIGAIHLVTKRLVQDFNRSPGSHLTSFGSTNAVCHRKNAALTIYQV